MRLRTYMRVCIYLFMCVLSSMHQDRTDNIKCNVDDDDDVDVDEKDDHVLVHSSIPIHGSSNQEKEDTTTP